MASLMNQDELLASLAHETKIINHLAKKILPSTLDWKPSPPQRSILELLQYLANMGTLMSAAITIGNASPFAEMPNLMKTVTVDNFTQKMDEQLIEIKKNVSSLSDERLSGEADLFGSGMKTKKSLLLIESLLKAFVAYRMQLFLYIKASGNHAIGTADVWRGEDAKTEG